ncbi:MAG TPA: histidine kinase [bacterium]|nr:histidine kinase [bacterium]
MAAATAIILTVFAFIAFRAVQESTSTVLQQRLQVGTALADRIAATLTGYRNELEDLGWELSQESAPERRAAVLEDSEWARRFSALAIIGPDGRVIWSQPASWFASMRRGLPLAVLTAASGGAAVLPPLAIAPNVHLTALAVPLADRGVLLGAVDLERLALRGIFDGPVGASFDFEIMDAQGIVRASAVLAEVGRPSEHLPILAPVVRPGRQAIVYHNVPRRPHYVVYTPLAEYPGWSVNFEEPSDVVLSLPHALRNGLLALGAVIMVGMSTLAFFDTKGMLRPLARLRKAAEHIAGGNLDDTVDVERRDEVGALAQAFEAMRVKLRASRDEIAAWNRELEDRVASRTRELSAAHALRRQLLERIVLAHEEERRRIARELHDEIGQGLTALVMQLGTAEGALEPDADGIRPQLQAVREQTSEMIENVRRLMLDLRPAVLDDLGLVPAIRWYAESHLPAAGIDAQVSISGLDEHERLPRRLELVAFRLAQEAVTNVIRHAQARRAVISLARVAGGLEISVEDDGRGFDPEAAPPTGRRGWGLAGMRERVALLGGTLSVTSHPGCGTRVAARIPVEETPDAD